MKNRAIQLAIVLTALVFTQCASPQEQTTKATVKQTPESAALTVDEVLWWLPPDTETLMVAQGPFQLISLSPRPDSDGRLLEQSLQYLVLGNLEGPEGEGVRGFPKPLEGARVQFAVQGSRNFRAPHSLGGMPFDGCSILVFADDFGGRGDDFLKYLNTRVHPTKGKVAGLSTLIWKEKLEEDWWEFFLVRIRPNVFLVATQEAYLRETLERMRSRGSVRALPESLPEWKFVNRQAPFWAIRHFRRGNEKTDPSSPFGGKKAANEPDEQAVGVAFSYGTASGQPPAVYYLSDNPKAVEIARRMWSIPQEGLNPHIQTAAPSAVQIRVPVPDVQAVLMFLFVWSAVVGQGTYV